VPKVEPILKVCFRRNCQRGLAPDPKFSLNSLLKSKSYAQQAILPVTNCSLLLFLKLYVLISLILPRKSGKKLGKKEKYFPSFSNPPLTSIDQLFTKPFLNNPTPPARVPLAGSTRNA